jgi:hypothetical protein
MDIKQLITFVEDLKAHYSHQQHSIEYQVLAEILDQLQAI